MTEWHALFAYLLIMHTLLAVMAYRLGQIRDMMRDERDRRKEGRC